MEFIASFLPAAQGVLPYYMLVLSAVSIGNSLQSYATLHYSRRVYNGRFVRNPKLGPATGSFNPEDATNKLIPAKATDSQATDQLTPLAGRLFGTWTIVSCMVRMYAAYNIHIGPIYDMAHWTYMIALFHFGSELFVYKTLGGLGLPQFFPFLIAVCTSIWMPLVRSSYVTVN